MSRGKNASAVAKAAYISGEKIKNELNRKISDYRRKSEIVHKEILLPLNAPPKFKKRSVLWNEVEFSEKRKNSQTARHINAALPVELSLKEQIDLVEQFCKQCFVSKGMCVDFAIHDKHDGNPHVHILLTTRRVDESGFTEKDRSWNDKALLLEWRKLWADWCNHKLYFVSDERIDHRSYKAQGIDKIPQVHLGASVCAIEKKGYNTDKGSLNRKILLENLENDIEKIQKEIQLTQSKNKNLSQTFIELQVGCPISEMLMFKGEQNYIERIAYEMKQRGYGFARTKSGQNQATIYFSKEHDNVLTEILQQLNAKTKQPEKQQSKTTKKRHTL